MHAFCTQFANHKSFTGLAASFVCFLTLQLAVELCVKDITLVSGQLSQAGDCSKFAK
jgi:hypothetical protein